MLPYLHLAAFWLTCSGGGPLLFLIPHTTSLPQSPSWCLPSPCQCAIFPAIHPFTLLSLPLPLTHTLPRSHTLCPHYSARTPLFPSLFSHSLSLLPPHSPLTLLPSTAPTSPATITDFLTILNAPSFSTSTFFLFSRRLHSVLAVAPRLPPTCYAHRYSTSCPRQRNRTLI